ncbi:TetR/AcrR family transcriptional regulator [Cronobacter sakazakii]|uniref:TetR/AcrR family transcriptional regulator n=1 Tax=Cronobacter sakazakii TaxID=28141 RepID=UPI000CFBF9B6|nr:TetR/AcrR family transcriptional regulator [Cronobacter sakazakii]
MAAKRRIDTMEENRAKLIAAARKAFAEKGFAAASMDELTASVGLTRGALYHNFGDKKGLLAVVVAQVDGEMAQRAKAAAAGVEDPWETLIAEGVAYIQMALDEEVRRIVLLDGPAFLGDPAQWPSQNSCLDVTRETVISSRAALNAALWVAASPQPAEALPKMIEVFTLLAGGLRA